MSELKTVTLGIEVTIPEAAVQTLTEGVGAIGKDSIRTLSGLATGLLADLADGGMMLPPGSMRRILKADPQAKTPAAVVGLVDASVNRRGDSLVAEWIVDPVYEASLAEQARMSSMTVQQLVQNVMDHVVQRGVFFRLKPEPGLLIFSAEDIEMFRDAIGKQKNEALTGTEVGNYIRDMVTLPETV